ncbi:PP2C family protein-serine/threonine phosphatase [Rubinisphaera italica]|uniref:Phosphoserine phosphatase RsbU n=1 Tax=Rubinisphaera italica TaxID=2527969 RepID=A0A5C5XIT2_9PLAN|nr:SpoIIE family protein phosphatase [Rubinisphaera italica]TWT62930.1 Phosphoserine phosphatase RsbU [Rubinisphaera italica]
MKPNRLPKTVVLTVLILTLIIAIMSLGGWGISYTAGWTNSKSRVEVSTTAAILTYYEMSGPFYHTILEWTSVCLAIFTGILSIVHYRLKRDVTTPIIGTALFFSGMLDAFNILAADRLVFAVKNLQDFIPFTWAVSRTFNVAILTAGTLPFIVRKKLPARKATKNDARYLILVGFLFGLVAYVIIHFFAVIVSVPDSQYPELWISRPWELIPFVFWMFLGTTVFPRFWKKFPSLFSHSLILCAIPAALLNVVAGLGSRELFDANFFNAYYLKILAYGTPLIGLLLDYKNAYRAEMELEKTASKLEAAKEIQQSLLPDDHPEIAGIDAAGFSYASEAVGGDYYDYLRLADGRFAFVVGDVSGHDLAASLLAAQTRAYLRAYVNSHGDLVEVMTRLNQALVIDTQHRRFVTMFLAAIDKDLRSFEYIAAGHQGYLVRHDGQIETLDSNVLPVGMTNENKMQVNKISRLHRGDTVLVVTDGITEAVSPTGEQYGLQRLLDFISVEHERSVKDLVELLQADVNRFCEGKRPTDDVTVLLVRWLRNIP